MKTMDKQSKTKIIFSYVFVILTAILLAFNYQLFIVQNGFAPAGINGIATMIQYKTGFSIGYMSLIINVPLCIWAYFTLDKTFAKRSLVFCITYSFVFLFLQSVGLTRFQYNAHGHDTIFPVILSGVISGFVYGTCFRMSASTGGTDIVSKYINKKKPELNFFWITFTLNAIVAAISFFVYAKQGTDGKLVFDYKPVCLCILYCFISSFVGNTIISGTKSARKFTIITSQPEQLIQDIVTKLKHGATQITVVGTYSHEEKTLLFCVVDKHQLVDFQNILSQYEDTFAFSETVNEIYGNYKKVK